LGLSCGAGKWEAPVSGCATALSEVVGRRAGAVFGGAGLTSPVGEGTSSSSLAFAGDVVATINPIAKIEQRPVILGLLT
jgi:hypothetical protein